MRFEKITDWYRIFASQADMEAQVQKGRAVAVVKGGKKICIAHSNDGFFAVSDRCPHNGFSLSKGNCSEDNAIVCPLHRYRFDLRTGRSKGGIADYVDTFKLDVREDGVYVGIERSVFKWF
jgi:nitrite reductase/ring-hydroxylating ferredoxin subunit